MNCTKLLVIGIVLTSLDAFGTESQLLLDILNSKTFNQLKKSYAENQKTDVQRVKCSIELASETLIPIACFARAKSLLLQKKTTLVAYSAQIQNLNEICLMRLPTYSNIRKSDLDQIPHNLECSRKLASDFKKKLYRELEQRPEDVLQLSLAREL